MAGIALYSQREQLDAIRFLTKSIAVKRWEYKIVEVDNFAHYLKDEAFKEFDTNAALGLKDVRSADSSAGTFGLDYENGKYGIDLPQLGADGWELVSAVPLLETLPWVEYQYGTIYNSDTHQLDPNIQKFNNIRTGEIRLVLKRVATN